MPTLRRIRLAAWRSSCPWTATFARRLPLSPVFGLGRETAEALADSGELADLLGGVPAVLAHADTRPALTAAGLRPG